MDYLRKAVTGLKTSRFQEQGFDLDLTYVTDRIIAMSFPGSGFETIYRNALKDVAKMLQKRHGSHYLVLNLSGNPYDYKKFQGEVREYPWEDHHSPPIPLLFEACKCIHAFLRADPRNVVVVHCMAGKGRTGTVIVSYMLYCGRFETSEQALEYYKKKRFESGGGVTQPSQLRAVRYFEKVFNSYVSLNKIIDPVVVQIDKVVMHGVPNFTGGAFKPIIKVISVHDKKLLFTTEVIGKPIEYNAKDYDIIDIDFGPKSPVLTGDILLKVYHVSWNTTKAFRLAFNTSFLDIDSNMKARLRLDLDNIDPHEIKKDTRFPLSFTVDVHFKVLVNGAKFDDPEFKTYIDYYEKDSTAWQQIYAILKEYKSPSKRESSLLLFTDEDKDDVEKVLGMPKKMFQQMRMYSDDLGLEEEINKEIEGE